ncbi:response regulator transcription factor [Chryseobacterium sp. POL2]|uniref:response regulator transcription factor n=1 Tax=Chryseobacterium sp. POL2 TaxID=2713414 RepID=UPI0013E1DC4B|nr:response regulator transcription factor [Chryseobacterium sp. POL2]QIG89985.1 response regulator transcription factor [Chryseobacterium sp. POL2]
MLNRVLIAEDFESTNFSLQKILEEFGVQHVDFVYYCDDAYSKIRKAIDDNAAYELLVTDLNFEEDHYIQTLKDGEALIDASKKLQENLKVLVFSANDKSGVVDRLVKQYDIDAFVRKARSDFKNLKHALQAIQKNEKFFSENVRHSVRKLNTFEFSTYDIYLIDLLAKGVKVKEIPAFLEEKKIKPFGLSSVEKRISLLKDSLDLPNNAQLVAFCKDLGII